VSYPHNQKTYLASLLGFSQRPSLRDSRGELLSIMPILANIGTHGCDVFDRNEKVRKEAKHDFWTYFCQLMLILAYIEPHGCNVFDRKEKVEKAPKRDFWTYRSVLCSFVARNSLRESRGELLSIKANIGIY
jgi:hypothetical protein